jgi:hypothetical protein
VLKGVGRLCHQTSAYTLALQRKADVQVIEQGTPLGVNVKTGMSEADHFAVTVGDDGEMGVVDLPQPVRPNRSAVLEHISIEVRVRVGAPEMPAPAVGMQASDLDSIRRVSGPVVESHLAFDV